jgi:hypothetical protein
MKSTVALSPRLPSIPGRDHARRVCRSVACRVEPGCGGRFAGPHVEAFSVPFDDLDEFHNLFNLPIAGDGTTVGLNRLPIGRWFELELQWDGDQRQCIASIDGRQSATLRQNRESLGACYLRLVSTATATDNSGLMVERVEASVTPGS